MGAISGSLWGSIRPNLLEHVADDDAQWIRQLTGDEQVNNVLQAKIIPIRVAQDAESKIPGIEAWRLA
jgi:hypothetical protein